MVKYILSVAFCSLVVLLVSATPAAAQLNHTLENFDSHQKARIKVSIISDSKEFELRKGSAAEITVRVENLTGESYRLEQTPLFNFRRVGVADNDVKFGDSYTGRIPDPPKTERQVEIILEKNARLDFSVNLLELELMDRMSSIDSWPDLLKVIKKGDYYMEAEAELSRQTTRVQSTSILVRIL